MRGVPLVRDRAGGGRECIVAVGQPVEVLADMLTGPVFGTPHAVDALFRRLVDTHGARAWDNAAEADCDLLGTVHLRLTPDGWRLHRPGAVPIDIATLLERIPS